MEVYFIYTVKIFKNSHLLGILFIIFIFVGCNKSKKKVNFVDESVYSAQNFTELVLDSAVVVNFLNKSPETDSIKNQVSEFYARRNFQFAWFNSNGLTLAASNFYSQLQTYSVDFEDNSLKNSQLDILINAAQSDEKQFLTQKSDLQQLDLLLTTTFFKYAQKAYSGTTKNTFDLEWFIPRKKKNYQVLLDSLVSQTNGEKIQEPVNQYYLLLKEQLKKYRVIQKNGGFPTVITDKKLLVVGDSNACLVNTKKHLFLVGDLKNIDTTNVFTDTLAKAVQRFQHRMGLTENGKINHATIIEFNKPIEFRIKQMMVNMERLRWVPVELEKEYLLVNIPEFRLHIFENSKQVWATNVVVGKDIKQTSIFKGNISQIVLNPYWGIPMSIVKNEILPKIRQNPNYLARNNMEIINGNYRQKPGKNNALGKIKFLFPNHYSIYLHDTPSKSLFGETNRAFSHGCIRVENPKKLALYLLRKESEWNEEKVNNILKTDNETIVKVKPTVPVYIAYFTAWVDNTGELNFRNDLYKLDEKLSKEIFNN
ncbi:MAG: murein L,D-transpeptidase [Emticicia sp.]